jgi:UDP-N-acetylmuramate dehydrogenase
LPELLNFPAIRNDRLLVLGEGSNVLFTGDFDGTVLAMETRGVHVEMLATSGVQVESDGDSARIAVAAGERWDDFVRWTLGQGYAGLENLILIPGTVGAAPIQNIGAYGCEVAEFIESVEAWDIRERRVVMLDHGTCAFAYRDSLFKHEPGRYIVTAVRFVLPRSRPLRTDYAGINEQLARMWTSLHRSMWPKQWCICAPASCPTHRSSATPAVSSRIRLSTLRWRMRSRVSILDWPRGRSRMVVAKYPPPG